MDQDTRQENIETKGTQPVVLVAEDEALVLGILKTILQGAGYTVLGAVDGQDAIEISRKYPGPINLLITDIEMPRMNGNELVAKIIRERPHMKVIALSGFASNGLQAHQNIVCFLSKPFVPTKLLDVVAEAISTRSGIR